MKKIFLTLSLALTALVVSAAVGDKVEKGNVSYTVTTMPTSDAYGRVTVSGLSASGKAATNLSLFIPSIIYIDSKEYEVFDIAKSAFSGCTNINTVSINYGLWGICASAFQGCTNLKMLRIPSTCLSIEANAFYGCSKLFEVYFAKADPRGYLYSASAFPSNSNMTLFTTKTDPNSAQYAKAVTAFSKFTTVKKSSYAYDLSTSDGAMLVVTKHPGKGVRGEVALVGIQTSMLGSDKIFKPYNYNGVDGYLYTLTSVADSACINLTDLKGIDLTTAPSLATIGVRSFYGCTALSTATLNEGLTTIKSSAFAFDALTTITLPKTVTSCSAYFVDRCKQLTQIIVAAGNTKYSSQRGCLYNADGSTLLRCPEGEYGEVIFSKNVKSIGAYAFDNCTNLTRVDIPYGVTTIGNYAFTGCSGLKHVAVPATCTNWGTYAFHNCSSLADLYVNVATPATLPSDYFSTTQHKTLHVASGKINSYKSATGWSVFGTVTDGAYDLQKSDIRNENISNRVHYVITSAKAETINGKSYGGRASLVKVPTMSYVESLRGTYTLTVPDALECNGKTYAVTSIAENAAKDATFDSELNVKLGVNVDTVGAYAFSRQSRLTRLYLNPNLKMIGDFAFSECSITSDIYLPYGLKRLANGAFESTPISSILIPSSVTHVGFAFVMNNPKLQSIVVNNTFCGTYTGWHFDGIPSTCKVYVPTGCVQEYKNNPQWGKLSVTPGAYDFAWNNNHDGIYHITVTSATPVTKNGVTYAGKAKYVYHPAVQQSTNTNFVASDYETDNTLSSNKKYLMTEIGDSCLAYSKVKTFSNKMSSLERIGHHAFLKSALTGTFEVPATCTYLGKWAFMGCTGLSELMVMPNYSNLTIGGQLFGGISNDLTCYVKWTQLKYWQDQAGSWTKFSTDSKEQVDRINGYFVEDSYDVMDIAVNHPVNWNLSAGIQAYIVPNYNPSTQTLKTLAVSQTPTNTGLLITGFEKGKIYKLRRPSTTPTLSTNNLLVGTAPATVDIFGETVGFYFSNSTKKFIKPTKSFKSGIARSYLKLSSSLAGSTSTIYVDQWHEGLKGDVNGDGVVNVSDVTALINKILGTASYSNEVCDIDGNGAVNVSDVTALINLILG